MLCRAHSSEWEGSLLLRRIQSPEILEHQPTLLGGETLELLPPGVPESRARARRARLQDVGDVHAVSGRGPADPFFVLVGLVVRERAAGVEQSAVQALLALDGLLVEAPSLELTCELLRLLRERTGGGVSACFPAASRIWRATASVPSSTAACRERVAAPASPRRSASATCSCPCASAAVSESARSSAASVSPRHSRASESR